MKLGSSLIIGGALFALAIFVGLFAPWLAHTDPVMDANLMYAEEPPGWKWWFGTDAQGRDTIDYGWSQKRYVYPEDIEATIYSAMGIDWTTVRHDDPLGRTLLEQGRCELADGLARGALAHADQHDTLSDRHHIAAFQRRQPVIFRGIAPPDVDLAGKVRVELVDRDRKSVV